MCVLHLVKVHFGPPLLLTKYTAPLCWFTAVVVSGVAAGIGADPTLGTETAWGHCSDEWLMLKYSPQCMSCLADAIQCRVDTPPVEVS